MSARADQPTRVWHPTRRGFLLTALAAPALDAQPQVSVVMRVSDGEILEGRTPEAAQWLLPPGSAVKPFVLEALLDLHKLNIAETYLCPGKLYYRGHNLTCSHPRGLPAMDVTHALAYSCNCAVAHFAERLTPQELSAALQRAGFQATPADTILQALGEEGLLVTPIQLANAYRRLAQRANRAILEGMEAAVQFGTAQAAASPHMTIAGKTGSAITTTGLRAAWFAGFAPSRAPQIVVVVVTQGRSGGADAAPAAPALFEKYVQPTYRVRIGQEMLDMPVEQYVAAVLAGESSVFTHAESLKAMAVAARTFAAHEKGRHAKEGFDFCNTTHCQRAEPSGITPQLTAAAQSTAGQLLRFRGQIAFTPYTMSCGGMSESVEAVWPEMRAAYLGIHPDPFCGPITWTRTMDPRDIARALRDSGLQCPDSLSSISVATRTASGRARDLMLHGRQNILLNAGAFRFALGRALGWNTIRSNFFDFAAQTTIRGKGEGHGVGLCQRGAERMAAQGHTCAEILAFYYPGASTLAWQRLGGEGVTIYTTTDVIHTQTVLSEAERSLKQLPWPIPHSPEIYLYPTLESFRNATSEPSWVAAHSEGNRIDLQPIEVLQRRGILRSTLRHEILHLSVEGRAHADLPLWFREGIVGWLAGERVNPTTVSLPAEEDLRQRGDRSRASQAYRAAQACVAALIQTYGESTVLGWVSRGLPAEVTKSNSSAAMTNSK